MNITEDFIKREALRLIQGTVDAHITCSGDTDEGRKTTVHQIIGILRMVAALTAVNAPKKGT